MYYDNKIIFITWEETSNGVYRVGAEGRATPRRPHQLGQPVVLQRGRQQQLSLQNKIQFKRDINLE